MPRTGPDTGIIVAPGGCWCGVSYVALMAELREIGPNSVPIHMFDADFHEGDIEVKAGKPGEVLLDVTTLDGMGITLSIGAAEVAHLIHLLANELGRTEPLEGFALRD